LQVSLLEVINAPIQVPDIFHLTVSSSILALKYAFFLFLKCLLASRLTLFGLSTMPWLGFCIHCILACFLLSKIPKHSSSNHGLCYFSSCRPRLRLAEVLIFSLTPSHALFISSWKYRGIQIKYPIYIGQLH
jgi:hypothetical protein